MPLLIAPHFSIPDAEIDFSFVRSSGPGGQNVNKVNSKAVLRWNARDSRAIPLTVRPFLLARLAQQLTVEGDLIVTCDEYRDQPRNRDACLEKLRAILQRNLHRPKTRKTTSPSYSSKKRAEKSKRLHSNKKKQRRSGDSD